MSYSQQPPEGVLPVMISEEKRSKSESYTQLPHLPEKTVPYSVYANTLEKLDLVEDQKSKLQQKVDE